MQSRSTLWIFLPLLLALAAFSLSPALDIGASALFYSHAKGGFWLAQNPILLFIHNACTLGTRIMAVLLALWALIALIRRKPVAAKAALFLLVALAVGPGLVANTLLKDQWGRARPNQIREFGGHARYTPPVLPTDQCDTNCSFIAGDPSLGFALHAPFYLVAAPRRRRVFWSGFWGGGLLLGFDRLAMGGHFASDILWAGLIMLATTALVHACVYGPRATRSAWLDI